MAEPGNTEGKLIIDAQGTTKNVSPVEPKSQPIAPAQEAGASTLIEKAVVAGVGVLGSEVVDFLQKKLDAKEADGDDISKFSYKEIREALDSGKLGRKELAGDEKDELSIARRERYEEAEKLGLFDGARKALVETLVESEWNQSDYITRIDGLAQKLEGQAQMVRGYRGNPKLEGVVADAIGATHLLARFDGLIHASNNAIAKGLKVDRETLDELANQIRSEVLWNPKIPKGGYKAYIDQLTPTQVEAKRKEQKEAEDRRRQDDKDKQRADAEKQAGNQRQQLLEATNTQTQKLKALEEKLGELKRGGDDAATKAVERQIAGLRQDMAGRAEPQPTLTAESLTMPNPDAIETVLLDRLREGKWKAGKVGAMELSDATSVYDAITKLDGAADSGIRERAKIFRAMASLITDIGSEGRNDPSSHTRNTLSREDQVELEKREGVMAGWRKLMEVAGFNFGTIRGEEIWNLWESNDPRLVGVIDRTRILGDSFTGFAGRQEYAHLFANDDRSSKTFWQLKSEDMVDSNGRKGYVSMMVETVAHQMNKGADDPEVKRAVMVSIGLLKHSRVLEMFATDYDHPWINTEWYRLMHPAEYFRKRAVANHDSVSEAPLASYTRMYRADFPIRDGATGEYGAGTLVEDTNYRYHEIFFPPDWLRSWIFAPDVMRKVNGVATTMWDYLGGGTIPTQEAFNAKNIWEVENLRRAAAVELDNLLYKKTEKINTGKGEPWADAIALQVAGIVKKMGVVNKYVAMEVRSAGDLSPLESKYPQIHRVLRAATMARIGMGMDRGRLAVLEDKAFVIATGMERIDDAHKFTNTQKFVDDSGNDLPDLPIDMEDKPFLEWIKRGGTPYQLTKAYEDDRRILSWLTGDELAIEVVKIKAQGLTDENSLHKIELFNNRYYARRYNKYYGGLGTNNNKNWRERDDMWTKRETTYNRLFKRMNLDFE